MKRLVLTPRTFGFVLGTRAALAAGLGLLLSGKLAAARRRAIGTTLVAIGAVTTIPAAISVARSLRRTRPNGEPRVECDKRLIGATRFPRKGDDDLV